MREQDGNWRVAWVMGMGTAVLLAWLAYLMHVPTIRDAQIGERVTDPATVATESHLPAAVTLTVLIAGLVAGGLAAGRLGGRRVRRGRRI